MYEIHFFFISYRILLLLLHFLSNKCSLGELKVSLKKNKIKILDSKLLNLTVAGKSQASFSYIQMCLLNITPRYKIVNCEVVKQGVWLHTV